MDMPGDQVVGQPARSQVRVRCTCVSSAVVVVSRMISLPSSTFMFRIMVAPDVAGGERADQPGMHVAARLVHLIRAEVGVIAADCGGVVLPPEHRRRDRGAAVALHELRSEVPGTIEEQQREGVRAQSGFVNRFARRIPIEARKQAPCPDQVMTQGAHHLQGKPSTGFERHLRCPAPPFPQSTRLRTATCGQVEGS